MRDRASEALLLRLSISGTVIFALRDPLSEWVADLSESELLLGLSLACSLSLSLSLWRSERSRSLLAVLRLTFRPLLVVEDGDL